MANVLFKQGLQSALDTIRSNKNAIEGAFYLTTDTHRLYIGRPTGEVGKIDAVPVNQGITFVSTVNDLPAVNQTNKDQYAGQFYYLSASNILCVYNGDGTQQGWVQINPNTDTHIDDIDFTITTANNVATIKTTVKNVNAAGDFDSNIEDSFTIKGAGGTTVTSTGTEVTVSSEKYTLGKTVTTDNNILKLNLASDSKKNNSSVSIKGGNNITFTENNGTVTIAATTNSVNEVSVTDKAQGFDITVTDDLAPITGSFDPVIQVGTDTSAVANNVHFANGTATLPVYTKDDIDKMLRNFDAMEFRGVILSSSDIDQNVKSGYVYKVGQTFTFNNVEYKIGDLLIASGTESKDTGYITGDITWQRVSSGDGAVVTYKGVAVTNGLKIEDNSNTKVAEMVIAAGNKISVRQATSESNTKNTITVNHATTTTTSTKNTAQSQQFDTPLTINAITKVEHDNYGHVTKIETTPYSLKDTNGKVANMNTQISSSTTKGVSKATLTNSAYSVASNGTTQLGTASGSYEINSSSLNISSTAATINAEGAATKQATMTIDMVWGTF